jgi:NAD(P)-dependent dehydrogenase (short-subunit alcohol dehydrogenase family)
MQIERGQVAVVIGGASGLGLALAERFAIRGMSLVLGDVDTDPLAEAVARFEADDVPVLGAPTDVRDAAQVDALAAATLERFGRVDLVVNAAGVATFSGATWQVPLEDWRWVLSVNLDGVVHGIRSFVPHLVAQGSGHVVNVASMAGVTTGPGLAPYLVSKHGVVALSQGLRDELAELAPGVGVTTVCPGTMATQIHQAERNRPAELQRPPSEHDGVPLAGFRPWARGMSNAEIIPAAEAAPVVVAAIEADEEFAFPNGAPGEVLAWHQRVEQALPKE